MQRTFVTSVAVGYRHVIAIERFRSAFAWGNNTSGELGVGDKVPFKQSPTLIKSVSGIALTGCAASRNYSFLLTDQGELYSFGSNEDGKLGVKNSDPKYCLFSPTLIEGLRNVVKISAGPNHAMAITEKILDSNHSIFYKLTTERD